MKQLNLFIIGLILCSCSDQEKNTRKSLEYIGDFSFYKGIDTTITTKIDEYKIDLDFDQQIDTIVLENVNDLMDDPQIFTIVKVKLASGKEFVIHNVGGYTQDAKTRKQFPNRINSDKIYIPAFSKNKNYLIIWDYQYPSCDNDIAVFKMDQGDLNQVLNENFTISEINDFDKNGKIDLKGKLSCDENEPFSVLTIE